MKAILPSCFVAVLVLLGSRAAPAVEIISSGYVVPETISLAPADFGTYGGSYFIPDFGTRQIMVMPAAFGAPSVFQTATQTTNGGRFLPAGFGTAGGKFIVVGRDPTTAIGQITAYDASGNATPFGSSSVVGGLFDSAITPANYGSFGGLLAVTDTRGVAFFDQSGNYQPFVPELGFANNNASFGLAFAPDDFGAFGGSLLVSNAGNVNGETQIVSVAADGTVSPFATLNLQPGQTGLRQMAFAPDDFGPYGGLLFVSVTGSIQGGGAFGALLALDAAGQIVATLKLGTEFDKFDPRGMLFLSGGQLLLSDASDPILLATAGDFRATPEPGSLVLCCLGGLSFLVVAGRRRALEFKR